MSDELARVLDILEAAGEIAPRPIILTKHIALIEVLDPQSFINVLDKAELRIERRIRCTAVHQFCQIEILAERI